jgi:hypothetical protein
MNRIKGGEFFAVQTVKTSAKEHTLWHDKMENLEGVPVLVQIRRKFYIAIIDEDGFPEVVRIITFSSLCQGNSWRPRNELCQLKLKIEISKLFLIGWCLSEKEKILLEKIRFRQAKLAANKLRLAEEAKKEERFQRKRERKLSIQSRLPIEIVVPGKGKKTGIPVLESEWATLKDKTRAVLMNGEKNSKNSLGLPVAYFEVDKSIPSKPKKYKFINLLEAVRGHSL